MGGGAAAGEGTAGGRLFVNQTPATLTAIAATTTADRMTARMVLCPATAVMGALWKGAGTSACTNPQRHPLTLDGTRRPHEGQTQVNAGEVVCGIRKDPGRAEGGKTIVLRRQARFRST